MKRFFTTAMLLVVMNTVILAQPTAITWQGKLLDINGNAITQNNVSMNFAMYDASTGGNQLWPASGVVTKTVDVVQGLYSVQLGTGTGDDIYFTAAMFNGKTPWLEVKVGTETLPRTEITNVPFALISNDLSAAGWENPGEIGKTTPNTGKFTSVETESLKVTTGASDGKILTSDGDGNASWQVAPVTGAFTTSSNITSNAPGSYASDNFVFGSNSLDDDGNADHEARFYFDKSKSAFRAGKATGEQWNDANRGDYSFGSGYNTKASGGISTAMGYAATASGNYSMAIGRNTTASGNSATAIGYGTEASGSSATAMGHFTTAQSGREMVVGSFNTSYTPVSTAGWDYSDRLFVVGNGISDVSRSNAITILKNANTTIGGSLTINSNGTNASIVFPTGRGSNGQVLTSNGIGGTSWATPSGGTVTGVTGTLPIVSTGGTAPEISINPATTSAAGSMSAADKTKLDAISGTNTGDQTITLAGDVTGSGTGSFEVTIYPSSVNNIKLANMAANTMKVNNTSFTASPSDLSITANTFPARSSSGNIAAKPVTDFALTLLDDASASNARATIGAGTGNGTVTSVSGTAPIVSTGGTDPVLSINPATTSAAGSMSAADKTKLNAQATGTASGQMQYWNGTAWVTIPVGNNSQVLKLINGVPTWADDYIENLSIGDYYQGGIIAYFLQPGDPGYDANVLHGIIAAPSDQSTNCDWGCYGTSITGADGTALGTGAQNTLDIVAGCNAPVSAARICSDLELNGYDDWYLPSKDELNKLYVNKDLIGGFSDDYYWTSSEYNLNLARYQLFFDGIQDAFPKSNTISVRAIRNF